MATQTQKIKLIDKLNVLFEENQQKALNSDYERFFNQVQRKLNGIIKGTPTLKEIRNIVNEIPIKFDGLRKSIYLSFMLSGITSVIENQQLDKQDKEMFAPILAVVGLYGLRDYKNLAKKVDKVTGAVLSNNSTMLSKQDKIAFKLIKNYTQETPTNLKFIQKQIKAFDKDMQRIGKDIKSNLSKTVYKNYKQVAKKNIPIKQVQEEVKKRFGDSQKARIERITRTEIKRQQELVKLSQHSLMGYTHKRWNTQQDSKVSLSHKAMQGKTIKLDKMFKIPGIDRKPTAQVMFPGDPSAPIGQTINERCFLTYVKRKA